LDHGFTREHFELLRRWANHHFDKKDSRQVEAYAKLKGAYDATAEWAYALQAQAFPHGEVEVRRAPVNQGHVFSPYTWAKIYPSPASPRALAFTVGIDQDGFVVKIDTVGNPPQRAASEALRGPGNEGSPFGAILPGEDGLRLAFEELVAWSARAIRRFRIGYDEVLERIGLATPKLALVTDPAESRRAFGEWRKAMLAGAVQRGSLYWLPEGGIVMRPGRSGREADEDRTEFGVDPTGRSWAVQINEPRIAGDHNSLSAIGVSASGERFLLRQGFLRPNEPGGHTISGTEFVSRSGLRPAAVAAEGLAARRQWFIVCRLDSSPEQVRLATSRFVDRCAAARATSDAGEAPVEVSPEDLFSSGESGGSYTIGARPAQGSRTILRRHGMVWLSLAELLTEAGISIRKGRHPLGFEVDAEIEGARTRPLLVEIKADASAGDIHAGVGQLHLYPRLLRRLASYDRALLLPRMPAREVRAAVEGCGIAVHTYDFADTDGAVDVTLSPDFLRRCGIEAAA